MLLLDTSTGRFASVDQEVLACFEQAAGTWAPQLYEAGFLADSAAACIAAQHALFAQQRADRSVLRLSLAPTYACNCRCPYCYESDKAAPRVFMSEQVEQAVYHFVEERYAQDGFTTLELEWYGGDPQLCLDVVARMAAWMQEFCVARGVAFDCSMLSNCTRIGPNEARIIAQAGVSSVLITVDGPEQQHNYRRPTVEGGNPYAQVKAAIGYLADAGVLCNVICNCDKVNLPLVPQLQEDLDSLGVSVTPVKLNDYGHFFGKNRFCKPAFDLFTHEEFHRACHDLMKAQGQLNAPMLSALLQPGTRFCNGQRNNYFNIDNIGDVYACDGRMGDARYALFNLMDGSEPVLDAVSFDPCEDPQCAACALLPLCWGNCRWEREECGMPCHPLKTCGTEYLTDFAACFPTPTQPFQLLV
ncbi:MAG: radical SAM protein [Coriobacteriia bacterium]|nr:radical SAM protein [Coriobacteriia bacterium]